ncbi:hypothetical protein V5F85_10580, partial [Xanthobacter autotrophicus ATCC 700551]
SHTKFLTLPDTSGVLKQQRLERAVDDVTGGTVRHNGVTIIAPRRGMDQATFDRVLSAVTNQDLAGARAASGTPITAEYLRDKAHLESVADGRYLVRLNRNAESPQYAAGPDGRPFILRLDTVQPAPPHQLWNSAPTFTEHGWPDVSFVPGLPADLAEGSR